MKQYIRHFLCLTIAMVMAMPNLVAQVDLQKSFYVMRNDSTGVTGKLEGGEWLIRFSDTDSLGNQFSSPVAMSSGSVICAAAVVASVSRAVAAMCLSLFIFSAFLAFSGKAKKSLVKMRSFQAILDMIYYIR